jgi:hypothetical protein
MNQSSQDPGSVSPHTGEHLRRSDNARLKVAAATFRQFRVRCHTDTLFVFAPTLASQAFGLFFFCFGLFIASASVWTCVAIWPLLAKERLYVCIAVVAMLPFAIAFNGYLSFWLVSSSLMLMRQTVVFDKSSGTVTSRRTLQASDVHTLDDVAAIQVRDVGWIRATFRFGGRRGGARRVHQFQLNLVLRSPPGSRLNICAEPHERFVRDAARELAAFLGVRLIQDTGPDRR